MPHYKAVHFSHTDMTAIRLWFVYISLDHHFRFSTIQDYLPILLCSFLVGVVFCMSLRWGNWNRIGRRHSRTYRAVLLFMWGKTTSCPFQITSILCDFFGFFYWATVFSVSGFDYQLTADNSISNRVFDFETAHAFVLITCNDAYSCKIRFCFSVIRITISIQ